VLTKANEVANFSEALQRVKYALNYNPPSTTLRWDKLLAVCNRGSCDVCPLAHKGVTLAYTLCTPNASHSA